MAYWVGVCNREIRVSKTIDLISKIMMLVNPKSKLVAMTWLVEGEVRTN